MKERTLVWEEVNELICGYANGLITDVELGDMLDLIPDC
jgi:hypothetical protein